MLRLLGNRTNPRVQAAYVCSHTCNGWCARGRFQQSGFCRFGCGHGIDKLEHFPTCPVVRKFLERAGDWLWALGVTALDSFLCMDVGPNGDLTLQKGLSLYALYKLYNGIRYRTYTLDEFLDAFLRLRLEGNR